MNIRRLILPVSLAIVVSCLAMHPSHAAQDCASITDPAGDVTIQGTTSSVPGADLDGSDIVAASVSSSASALVFDVTTKGPFVIPSGQLVNLDLMLDADGDGKNNYNNPSNERSGSDSFFVLISTTSSTAPWKVKHQVYNAASSTWSDAPTGLQFSLKANNIHIVLPRDPKQPITPAMRWRVVTNVGLIGHWFTRDSAPEKSTDPNDCGYAPFIPATTGTAMAHVSLPGSGPSWLSYGLVALGLAAMGVAVAKGRG